MRKGETIKKKEYCKIFFTNFFNDLIRFVSVHKKILVLYLVLCAILIPISWQQDMYDWYFVVGKLFSEGKNVYEPLNVQAIIKRGDTGQWGYPPLFLPLFSFSYVVSAVINLPFHVVCKSLVAFVNVLVAMELEKNAKSSRVVALYLFNPLILVSTIIQGFFDVLVIFFILLALKSLNKTHSAAYVGLSSLCKQTAWPLIPFFVTLNLNLKWFLFFSGLVVGGFIPFLILDFQAVMEAVVIQHQARIGISPWSTIVNFASISGPLVQWLNICIATTQLVLIVLLAVIVRGKLKSSNPLDKTKIFEYFVLYELVSLTFVYLIVPPVPHFLSYLLFPTILLMVTHPEFKYPYIFISITGYVVFTLDQGLRHNVFHYDVWAGPIYLGYYHLELLVWIVGACLSLIMYASFFYIFYKTWRRDRACTIKNH